MKMKKKQNWFYSETVKKHFFHPKNFITDKEAKKYKADGIGVIGNAVCGDVMKVWIKVNKEDERIKDMRWQTFGCASAIATTSILSEMVTKNKGMKIEDALKIKPADIVKNLKYLPAIKVHCSVLGDKALREAIKDYFLRTKQKDKLIKYFNNSFDKKGG